MMLSPGHDNALTQLGVFAKGVVYEPLVVRCACGDVSHAGSPVGRVAVRGGCAE